MYEKQPFKSVTLMQLINSRSITFGGVADFAQDQDTRVVFFPVRKIEGERANVDHQPRLPDSTVNRRTDSNTTDL